MADLNIPPAPAIPGAKHLHSGKVRDLYVLEEGPYAGQLLMVASDRISAFDHVFDTVIPDKGEILTKLSLWWFEQFEDLVPTHVLSTDVPESVAGRAVVAQKLHMLPVECVARGYLTGSGLREYETTGEVCGIRLPAGLVDGSRLTPPIFTPATKAELGDHDENVTYEYVSKLIGEDDAAAVRRLTLAVYQRADEIARGCGLILADTKFEFGVRQDDLGIRTIVLADEVLTPDSSRYWDASQWHPGSAIPSFDKDVIRRWLLSPESGWDRAAGGPPPELPAEIVERTRAKYVEAYEKLTGHRF
ncbi:phosphoribosylaminoimidazolesuccinocarboxamide synthase [Nocardioides albus]|uniref:Phosphoribosylaminoimidazole-succinocarboxamide synthase n=1 Tax=Nocardioides albus TaxID=1841 RepID=A0A7W5A7A0_9ACTN|nr:phosphoribosylaminoimidazolesuccinocarboxamide synthase [Nocardioides albus]MBB3090725.1 phosphoribosylaminoimidazole-succinocarboxamide synthase [Nocardioides albus]GGU26051.1 phosphoribosylaminoimidazole-succinocarboxamide synthase [Nocardioides albus]